MIAALPALICGALLIGATILESAFGVAPCELCLWQRWAHFAALLLALGALAEQDRRWLHIGLLGLCGAALLAGAGLAGFHIGVEQHWWAGTDQCGDPLSASGAAQSVEELKNRLMTAPVVRCDQVAWSLLGISLAGYNLLISLPLALGVLAAAVGLARARED